MDFRLLGPLEVVGDGDLDLTIGAGRQRALLALLLLHPNELVGSEQLVAALWGEAPPATANKMLQNQVSALRQALGRNGRIETRGRAYRLNVGSGERDVDRFEELVARGRTQLEADPERAAATLRCALQLWRGPPLSDLAYEEFAQAEIQRLEERRWAAFEACVDAELALDRHADLVAELEAAIAEQPLREHLHGALMLALYRSGRQAEALEAYRSARRTLVEEVGVEPGAELRALHDAVLAQDPALDLPSGPEELPAALDAGSPILAGRERELAALTGLLAEACEGSGAVAVVSGSRGSGKTRLAAEVARDALRRRAAVIYARPGDADDAIRRAAANERPVLLILDGAEDADLLERATELAAGRRVLTLVLRTEPARNGRSITLGPLADDAVAEIARLYLDAVPPGLAADSRGLPLAVHRLAAETARAHAARAAGMSAGRAATERDELRAAEAELSVDLLAIGAADERGRLYGVEDGTPARAVCPFLGLATFDAAHAEYFFGRERLVAELVARLVGAPLLAVIGRSGSGKSSAVRAGLLPALADGVLPGAEHWVQAVMRPGPHPLAALDKALTASDTAVLAVDQFEEVFTVCRDERERAAFLDLLVALTEDVDAPVQVIVAMRADFYGHCAAHDRLARLVEANQVLVGPMGRDELQRAIVEPARRVGLRVEPSLADALIADVLDEPGGLPLLSAALLEQWRERDGSVMRRAAYERTGGVRGAVGRLAESTYARLSDPQRIAARRILLRLADAGEEERFVRRQVPLDELDPGRDEEAAAALGLLVDSRLVTVDEGTVEVAHEALLREWPRLRGWLDEDAEGRRLHQHLIHAARDWDAAGRDPGELYRGARLSAALDWDAGHTGDLNALERQFLDASRAEAEHEADRQRRANRRLRIQLAGLGALLAVAVVAGIVALGQRSDARDAARVADAQRLGIEALGEERLDRALLLTRSAVALDESASTRSNLLSVLLRTPATLGIINSGFGMYGAAISPDGKVMATGDERGVVTFYDVATRRQLGRPYWIHEGLIQNVRFSPDGATLAVSSTDPEAREIRGVLDLVDVRTRRHLLRVSLPALPNPGGFVYLDGFFAPNGRDLIVREVPGSAPDGPVGPVYRVDRRTGTVRERLTVGRSPSAFYTEATADGGRLFLTSFGDDRTWEIDPDPLRVVRSWPVGDAAGAVSPDGRNFALGAKNGRVRLLDLRSGRVRTFRDRDGDAVSRMRFTPDGRTLITTDNSGKVLAWDVAAGTITRRFAGHTGEIDGLDLSADGRTLLTASVDTRAILWDLAGDRRLDRPFAVGARFAVEFTPRGIAVSPDGRTLALTQSDGTVDLLDTRTLRRRAGVHAIDGAALSVAYRPDGRLLAVAGSGGQVTLWDARTLAAAGTLAGMRADSQAVAFSPDGRVVAAAEAMVSEAALFGRPQPMRVWDARRHTLTGFRGNTSANLIAFSPDGRWIAAAATQFGTDIRDARTGRLVKHLGVGDLTSVGDFSRSVTFSPDGSLLFVGQYDGTGRLFSTQTWKPVGRPLEAHTGRITFPEFTPDGRTLVTAAADGTVVLWDVATQKPIGSPLRFARNTFVSAALSPDGSRLYAVSTTGEGISFDMSPEAWKRHACLVAGREPTADEWRGALPGRPYEAVCSGA